MAFQLGQFVATLMGDSTHLDGVLGKVTRQLAGVAGSVGAAGSIKLNDLGVPPLTENLDKAHGAAKNLFSQLLELSGLNLSNVLKFGSIAGIVGAVGVATKKFMDMQDELFNTQTRIRTMGLDVDSTTQRIYEFGRTAQAQFGIAASEARKMGMVAMEKGLNPEQFDRTAAAAMALGERFGIGAQRAQFLTQQIEAGHYQMVGRYNSALRRMIDQGASRQMVEQKLNQLIAEGAENAEKRQQTFGAQVARTKFAFVDLGVAVGNAIGPALAPLVSKFADGLTNVTKRVSEFVTANKEAIASGVRLGASLLAGVLAFKAVGMAASVLPGVLSALIPGFGLLRGAMGGLGMFNPFGLLVRSASALGGKLVALGRLSGVVGTAIVTGLTGGVKGIVGVVAAPLTAFRMMLMGIKGSAKSAGFSVRALGLAVRGALVATGVGAILVAFGAIASALMGLTDTFGDSSSGMGGIAETLGTLWKEVLAIAKPVLDWLKIEGMVVFKALVASARQFIQVFKDIWVALIPLWESLWKTLSSLFSDTMERIGSITGIKIKSMGDLWTEFTAELAVLGLRVRQMGLAIAVYFYEPAMQLANLWKTLTSFVAWLSSVNDVFASPFTLMLAALKDVKAALSDPLAFEFDSSHFDAELERINKKTKRAFEGFSLDAFAGDTTSGKAGLAKQLGDVTRQIASAKDQARAAQAKEREAAQSRDGKTGGDKLDPRIKIGNQDKARLTDGKAFWEKLQEAAASQRVEQIMQRQLDEQRETNRQLNLLNEKLGNQPKPTTSPGGVFPR